MDEIIAIPAIQEDEARVNVTFAGQNGELPDPVYYNSTDGDIRQMVTEAIRAGGVPGIPAGGVDANTFDNFMVDRFGPTEDRPHNLIMLRPKTEYGS